MKQRSGTKFWFVVRGRLLLLLKFPMKSFYVWITVVSAELLLYSNHEQDAMRQLNSSAMQNSIRIYSQLLSQKRTETEDLITLAKSYSATKKHGDALRIYDVKLLTKKCS